MIPTIGGADNITWAQEQRDKRRQSIEETLMALLWILVLCAASFWFGYANGANSVKPVVLQVNPAAMPDYDGATTALNHFNDEE